eukprot:6955714-Prymnesium_polylepis.1
MAVVNTEPAKTKGAAMCSQMAAANLDRTRMDDEDGGCDPRGPPWTKPTGLGWDVSTEPKNKEDMIALAKAQNPVVGFWDPLNIVSEDTSPETIGWFRHAEIKHGRVAMAGFVGYCVHANGIVFPWNIQAPIAQSSLTSNLPTLSFADISAAGSPGDMWDALPTAAKLQILLVVGFLEARASRACSARYCPTSLPRAPSSRSTRPQASPSSPACLQPPTARVCSCVMWRSLCDAPQMHGENSLALEADGQKHYVRGGKLGYYPSFQGRYPHPVPLDLWD